MRYGEAEVKSKKQVVGTAKYVIYEAVQEALDELGEEKVLELINAQVRTNEQNKIRSMATSGPSKQWLRDQAFKEITIEEFQRVAGDEARINALVEEKMEQIKARMLANAPTNNQEEDDD